MSNSKRNGHFANTVAGGVGGIFVVLIGHPFDTIKVRLQTSSNGSPGASERLPFHNTLTCFQHTLKNEVNDKLWQIDT